MKIYKLGCFNVKHQNMLHKKRKQIVDDFIRYKYYRVKPVLNIIS